jgi:hypothetical protein
LNRLSYRLGSSSALERALAARQLEHVQKKLLDFFDSGMFQLLDSVRFLPITWFHVIGKRSHVQIARKQGQAEFETDCLGLCGARDTFLVGTLKGVGRVYRQAYIDTYAKAGFAKLRDRNTPIIAADLRNGRVLPFHVENGAVPRRVLTDRGTA